MNAPQIAAITSPRRETSRTIHIRIGNRRVALVDARYVDDNVPHAFFVDVPLRLEQAQVVYVTGYVPVIVLYAGTYHIQLFRRQWILQGMTEDQRPVMQVSYAQ